MRRSSSNAGLVSMAPTIPSASPREYTSVVGMYTETDWVTSDGAIKVRRGSPSSEFLSAPSAAESSRGLSKARRDTDDAEELPMAEFADRAAEEHHDMSEMMIHQIIHTVEFLLGALSNTASYLRLWALSLAHSQLSEVFWKYLVHGPWHARSFNLASLLTISIGFGMWVGLTLGVLMLMESLSACLHALRLHWVEFQNKFYSGTGVPFAPFEIKTTPSELWEGGAAGGGASDGESVASVKSVGGAGTGGSALTSEKHHSVFLNTVQNLISGSQGPMMAAPSRPPPSPSKKPI
jgi:hypothetical protein